MSSIETNCSTPTRDQAKAVPSSSCQQEEHIRSDSESLSGDEDEGYDGDTGCGTPTQDSDELPDIDIEQVVRKLSSDSEMAGREIRPYYFVACEIRDTERS